MTTIFNVGDLLSRLEGWYISQCNGDWEHHYGLTLGSLDNPGWMLNVDLTATEWASRPFSKVEINRSEHNWLHCSVDKQVFRAAGGPLNLREMIETFLWFVDPFYDPSADSPQLSTLTTKPI